MSEQELLNRIAMLANQLGLLVSHNFTGWSVIMPGFPDLVIAGPAGVLIAELKSALGELNMSQLRWRRALRRASVAYFIWKPEDWHTGYIQRELHRLAGEESAEAA